MFDALKPLAFHGVTFHDLPKGDEAKSEKAQAIGNCPFCHDMVDGVQKKPKLYANCKTGLWDCKHCGRKGNPQTFLEMIWQQAYDATTTDQYKALAEARPGLDAKMLKAEGYAFDLSRNAWLGPIKNKKGSLYSLFVWQPGKAPMYTAGIPQGLGRMDHLSQSGPVFICEGPWDAEAFDRLKKLAKAEGDIVWTPSAGTFKDEWKHFFHGRDVYLLYDNDGPGDAGMTAAAYKLQGTAGSIFTLRWPNGTPPGWDLRDHIHKLVDGGEAEPVDVWSDLMGCLVYYESDATQASTISFNPDDYPKRKNIEALCKDFKAAYHFDTAMKEGLIFSLATNLSVQLPGDPIWAFIVGPASSGKTLLLRSFEDSPYCQFLSTISSKVLVSGMDIDGEDPSLIPKLIGKTLVLKEYTEVMTAAQEEQELMYGILRGAYDGVVDKWYGNGKRRYYPNCHFAFLAGVTDVIHGDQRASLGERFLKFQLIEGHEYDSTPLVDRALRSMTTQHSTDTEIRKIIAGYTLKHKISWETNTDGKMVLPKIPEWTYKRLNALAQLVSGCRATVPLTARKELIYRPTAEVGARVGKQLLKFGQCAAVVQGTRNNIISQNDTWPLMLKVAFSTAKGWSLDIIRYLMGDGNKGKVIEFMQADLKLPSTTLNRRLEDMLHLNMIERARNTSQGMAGQPSMRWTVTPRYAELWKKAVT